MSLTTYNFYNKDWFIAAQVVKEHKLSSNYNTYYSNYYSNARLYGPVPSFEFRLSGVYLNEFKSLYGANSSSIVKSSAIWLIDEETVKKLLNKDIINSKEKTVKTVESNGLSIQYNLGVSKEEANKHATLTTTDANVILDRITEKQDSTSSNVYQFDPFSLSLINLNELDELRSNITSGKVNFLVNDLAPTQEQIAKDITKVKQDFRPAPFASTNSVTIEELSKKMAEDKQNLGVITGNNYKASFPLSVGSATVPTVYSPYSEEDISDAITLISSKLTNTPYQQEKILDGGSIRLDLFTCTRRSVYAIELKKNIITLDHVKEKLDNKNYLKHIIDAYPDLNITFIFSSPKGITFDALMYLQEASRSIGEHKVIYKPTSNLLLDMINKKEKDLPSYYYKQILDKPIIKYLLQVN